LQRVLDEVVVAVQMLLDQTLLVEEGLHNVPIILIFDKQTYTPLT
jgi:hypothetical protein